MIEEFVSNSLKTYHEALRVRHLEPSHTASYEFAADVYFRTQRNSRNQYIEWYFSFRDSETECAEIPDNPLDILPKATKIGQVGYDCYLRLVQDGAEKPTIENLHFFELDRPRFGLQFLVQHSGNESREAKPDDEESQEVIRKIVDLYADGL